MTTYELFIGNFGSGKTELALNTALIAADKGLSVVLADLDIVNPYFRSSSKRRLLEGAGVKVIAPLYAGTGVDVPSVPAEFSRIFLGEYDLAVIDVGGDPTGAKVLGRYHKEFAAVKDRLNSNFVVNSARPMTSNAGDIVALFNDISLRARLDIKYLISNTNLAEQTTTHLVLEGYEIAKRAAKQLGIEVRWIAAKPDVAKALESMKEQEITSKLMHINIYMRPDWLSRGQV